MSFMLTQRQIEDRSKTVTRRLGWARLKPGDRLLAVDKAMGLRKGEKSKVLATIEVLDVTTQPLSAIATEYVFGGAETAREGFPGMTAEEFVLMFCREMKCAPETPVRRIEFRYVEVARDAVE